MRFSVSVSALAIAIVSLSSFACQDPGGPVEVQSNITSETLFVDHGETVELPAPNRESLVVIHNGELSPQGDRNVDVDRVIDAEVYAGPDDPIGDPHWITRARVLDAQGQILWTQRVNSLFQMLEFLNPVLEELSPVEITLEQLFQVARQFYPELLQFAVKVPHQLPGAHTYVLEVVDEQGDWEAVGKFSIDELRDQATPPSPGVEYEVDTMMENGPPRDRINVVILGDGYTESQRATFEAHSEAVAERLIETPPFREHADLFNINRVWTPSNHFGAGFDCNRPDAPFWCVQGFRDTVFETTFVIPALASEFGDLFNLDFDDISDRVALPLQLARVFEVASLAHYDEIIFISNSRKRSGFAGAYVAVVTAFDNLTMDRFPDVAVHEVGHTLGLLGDEYNIATDACYYNEPDIPLPVNIDKIDDSGEPQWSEWVDEQTPIPTPASEEHADAVGAFEGAYNCDFLVRPVDRCMMRTSGEDFCPVCSEQMVRRFYSLVDPAPVKRPPRVSAHRHGGVRLHVPVREATLDGENRYEVMWVVDGDVFTEDTTTIQLTREDGLSSRSWLDVTAIVRNQSHYLKTPDQAASTEFEFQLKLAD